MSFINPEAILKRMDGDEQYRNMFQLMKEESLEFLKAFKDDPKDISEWGHNYFCDIDGSPLVFDINDRKNHRCPLCGKVYTDALYEGVWVYNYRNLAILNLMKAAWFTS